jgi:hypothetical protein
LHYKSIYVILAPIHSKRTGEDEMKNDSCFKALYLRDGNSFRLVGIEKSDGYVTAKPNQHINYVLDPVGVAAIKHFQNINLVSRAGSIGIDNIRKLCNVVEGITEEELGSILFGVLHLRLELLNLNEPHEIFSSKDRAEMIHMGFEMYYVVHQNGIVSERAQYKYDTLKVWAVLLKERAKRLYNIDSIIVNKGSHYLLPNLQSAADWEVSVINIDEARIVIKWILDLNNIKDIKIAFLYAGDDRRNYGYRPLLTVTMVDGEIMTCFANRKDPYLEGKVAEELDGKQMYIRTKKVPNKKVGSFTIVPEDEVLELLNKIV